MGSQRTASTLPQALALGTTGLGPVLLAPPNVGKDSCVRAGAGPRDTIGAPEAALGPTVDFAASRSRQLGFPLVEDAAVATGAGVGALA